MAVYDRLSLTVGGGILDVNRMADQTDGAFVCIGLGGTGTDGLRKLKKEIYRHIKPDDPDSPSPSYRHFQFLTVDTDLEGTEEDQDTFPLRFQDGPIGKALQSRDRDTIRKALDRQSAWLNPHIADKIAEEQPLTGNRQMGRLLLIDNAEFLKARLTSLIKEAITGVTGDLDICIISGLSGGTGGGIFLDVCYMVRHVLETLGKDSALISGYFFLPDVNLSLPCISAVPQTVNHVRRRGYAALKELDYLMGLEEVLDRFVQNYGSFQVDTLRPPVDICYLISTTNSSGVGMPDGYRYGLSIAANYIMSHLTAAPPSQEEALEALFGPVPHSMNIEKCHGACYKYSVIGVSRGEIPFSEITGYLGFRLFQQMSDLEGRTPTEKELMNFITANGLTYENLLRQLTEGISYKISYPPEFVKRSDIIPGDRQIIDQADSWLSDALEKLEKNRESMTEPLKNYDIPQNPASIISKIFYHLYQDYAMDIETGPFFAMRLLGGWNNKNLLHVIDDYIQNNQERLSAEQRQEVLRKQDLTAAEQNLAKASFINKANRIKGYLEALNHWYVHLAIIDRHNSMKNLLIELRDQVVRLYNDFFHVMTIVMDTLIHTFQENGRLLEGDWRPRDPSAWQTTLKDIKRYLDKTANTMYLETVAKRFVDAMFQQWREWITQDEGKIAKLTANYVLQEFSLDTHRNMVDFLSMPEAESELIDRAINNREPLFWKNSLFDIGNCPRKNTVFVPFTSPELEQKAAEAKRKGLADKVRLSWLSNQVTATSVYQGIPLFAYQGLLELEKAYEETQPEPGLHLYENAEMDWREYLPSPIPASVHTPGHHIPRIEERNKKLTEELNEAREKGICCHIWSGYQIRRTKIGDTAFPPEAETADFLKEVRAHMFDNDKVDLITMKTNNVRPDSEDTVFIDNYLRSPQAQQIVREQLAIVKELEQKIAALEIKRRKM